jgi:hypothetical protein
VLKNLLASNKAHIDTPCYIIPAIGLIGNIGDWGAATLHLMEHPGPGLRQIKQFTAMSLATKKASRQIWCQEEKNVPLGSVCDRRVDRCSAAGRLQSGQG